MSLLKVSDLKFGVGKFEILRGVDLEVEEGEVVGLIGPNGSGKTTLFNCLNGFVSPTGGRVFFQNEEVTKMAPHKRAKAGMGRTFQNFGIFKEMTVMENMLVALESKMPMWKTILPGGRKNEENKERARELLKQVGLERRGREKASSLSGGQLRLLEIIRALAFGAELFLLDEPTAGVSPKMKDDVMRLLKKLQEMGKTVVIIEHDIDFIQRFVSRIVVMDQGRIVLDGKPEKVRGDKKLQEIYFGEGA